VDDVAAAALTEPGPVELGPRVCPSGRPRPGIPAPPKRGLSCQANTPPHDKSALRHDSAGQGLDHDSVGSDRRTVTRPYDKPTTGCHMWPRSQHAQPAILPERRAKEHLVRLAGPRFRSRYVSPYRSRYPLTGRSPKRRRDLRYHASRYPDTLYEGTPLSPCEHNRHIREQSGRHRRQTNARSTKMGCERVEIGMASDPQVRPSC
jgi:hypothetical protein